jgi:hypothetical protein
MSTNLTSSNEMTNLWLENMTARFVDHDSRQTDGCLPGRAAATDQCRCVVTNGVFGKKSSSKNDVTRPDLTSMSIVFVEPRPALFTLLEGRTYEYFPEENGVWAVPRLGTFDSDAHFWAWVAAIKPRLFRAELSRFLAAEDMPRVLADHQFDDLFELRLRDDLEDARSWEPQLLPPAGK